MGEHKEVINLIEKHPRDDRKELLRKRESYLQFTLLFCPIIGAKTMCDPKLVFVLNGDWFIHHHDVLEMLVMHGADVNVHDLAGYTPLHHCLTYSGHEQTMKMAWFLLEAGANPNAVNRNEFIDKKA